MATSGNGVPQNVENSIIRELFDRVSELSEAISTQGNGEVNREVRRVFTSANRSVNERPWQGQDESGNVGHIDTRGQGSRTEEVNSSVVNPSQNALPIRRPPCGIRRYFSTRQRPSPSIRQRKGKSRSSDSRPFLRDLILLSGPNDAVVPRQGARVVLSEHGHIITGCQFTKNMSAAQVEIRIHEAFDGKIPHLVDIELLMSVHTSLVRPTLAPDQNGIDGIILHRLFKNKPVYIRPSCKLLSMCDSRGQLEQEVQEKRKRSETLAIEDILSEEDDSDLVQVLEEVEAQPPNPVLVAQNIESADPLQGVTVLEEVEAHHQNHALQNGQDMAPDNVPQEVIPDMETIKEIKEVVVHRSKIRSDMVEIFKDANILDFILNFTVIDANGHEEKGKGSGVQRDVLTHFWHEFFTVLTIGSGEKTPYIRHDLQKLHWEAIARIIVYGYETAKYFPLQLSQTFLSTCLFGEEGLTKPVLLASFRSYITGEDRETFDLCLTGDFDPNSDDIMDFLSTWNCHKRPTKENVETILFELAHQELVQKPKYIVHCWAPILSTLKVHSAFQTRDDLANLYESKRPTAKKIIKMFEAEIHNDSQKQALDHIKRYVRSLEGKALKRFLHFVSGSDVIACEHITVTFNSMEGFHRRPLVHTCGPMLELPTTYDSYTDLAEEFTNIMRAEQAWSFDIV